MHKKKVLLIGSNGYIGSKIYIDLKNNYDFSLVDYCKHEKPLAKQTLIIDYDKLSRKFVQEHEIVILLAGCSSVAMCKGNFLKSFKNNVSYFVNLANKLRSDQKFIFASSSSVYGFTDKPAIETQIIKTNYENYDTTKHMIDIAAQMFDINYYSLRFGTVNGISPHTRSDIMINSMIYDGLKNNKITIFNKKIKRPILGIKDLCRAIETIIKSDNTTKGIYNLCSYNSSVEKMAKEVAKKLNCSIEDLGNSTTKPYDFEIDNKKFIQTFSFKFQETTKSIVDQFLKFDKPINWIDRRSCS